jgi:hypothetical protein
MFKRKKPREADTPPPPKATETDWAERIGAIEIFRAGTFRAMNGQEYAFSAQDVSNIAAAFDPTTGPVPVVIGHPKADHPAYAWVKDVYTKGDVLFATLEKVDPQFGELVEAGRYKRISAALYPPEAGDNPAQGHYYLRHVGFLGAAAPAVRGLKSVELAGDESDWIAFGEALSAHEIAAKYELEIRLLQDRQFYEKMADEGKVLPRDRDGLLAFMGLLNRNTMIAFSDSGQEETMVDWFKGYIARQEPQITFGPMDLGEDPFTAPPAAFAAPDGREIDHSKVNLHAKATQIMREKGVRFEDALDFVYGD